ncbi:Vitamin B12 import system permease protein BtuC [Brevibacterium casei]|uniref:Vitamin B12 import system permease protein BtuC n=1 Tax=Brevibacterium casei TaxID=33889 RepID=A0A449DBE2_9MICO|nr:Vitamin B12 import system permease protein BtuC [Brevibacterium casei]
MAARMRRHGPTGNDSMTNSEITGGQTRATHLGGGEPRRGRIRLTEARRSGPVDGEDPRTAAELAAGCRDAAVLALLAASLLTGVYDIFGAADGAEMFQITRIPRTVALVLAGAAMAMCGLVMQLLTQNRFVEPTTTGTTEWAGLGLMLTVIIYPEATILQRMLGAILAAFIGTLIFFLFLRRVSLKFLAHRPHRRHHARCRGRGDHDVHRRLDGHAAEPQHLVRRQLHLDPARTVRGPLGRRDRRRRRVHHRRPVHGPRAWARRSRRAWA